MWRETAGLAQLLTPRLQIQLFEFVETLQRAYLIMEYASGGDLLEYINRSGALPDNVCRRFFRQILLAIEHCHSRHIAHR
jgi:serine/threonine protein kinase